MDFLSRLDHPTPLDRLRSACGQLAGAGNRDAGWIEKHRRAHPEFYLMFLDKRSRCCSHGYFVTEEEPLETAVQRKLGAAMTACGIRPGWRVLDIDAGWGAFTEYAGSRGVHVDSLTPCPNSEGFVRELIRRRKLSCSVRREHFLSYQTEGQYDAIVNLGATQHCPDYQATLRQYQKLLKPGGRVYSDACAYGSKSTSSKFLLDSVQSSESAPVLMHKYLEVVADSPFELVSVQNDRLSYLRTVQHWASNLDGARSTIVERWGEILYRRFRLHLWGCVHEFSTGGVTAYRWLLQLTERPAPSACSQHRSILSHLRRALRF
jgi:cyclopropane-fatty-acyl-phospholipid synthase